MGPAILYGFHSNLEVLEAGIHFDPQLLITAKELYLRIKSIGLSYISLRPFPPKFQKGKDFMVPLDFMIFFFW